MPNVCTNTIEIATDTPQGVAARAMLLDASKQDAEYPDFCLDFNAIIPLPAEFSRGDEKFIELPDGTKWRKMSDAERAWLWEHWGTNRGGGYCKILVDEPGDGLTLTFVTAWAPPNPVLQAIADRTGATIVNAWTVEGEWELNYRTTFAPNTEEREEVSWYEEEHLVGPVPVEGFRPAPPTSADDFPF